MNICSLLTTGHIFLDVELPDKLAVLRRAAEIFQTSGIVKDAEQAYVGMKEREELMSTGVGEGIAIPHAAGTYIFTPGLVLLRLKNPIDFEALDSGPVDMVLAMAVPKGQTGLHLRILAGISRLCKNREFLEAVRTAEDAPALLENICRIEGEMKFH